MKKLPIILILGLLLAYSSAGAEPMRALPLEQGSSLFDLPYNPSHLMVKFRPGVSAAAHAAVLAEIGGWVEWDYAPSIPWQLIRFDMGIAYEEMADYCHSRDYDGIRRLLDMARRTAERKAETLRANPWVERVEFDWFVELYETDFIPNDPYFVDVDPVAGITTPQQWTSYDVQLPQAWDVSQGSTGVRIAIIDTGVDTDHPDLDANIARWPAGGVRGYDYVGGKNGTILELFLPVQQDANPDIHHNDGVNDGWGLPDPSAGDGNDVLGLPSSNCDAGVFHGTHCASAASGVTNNSRGVAGAGFNVKIMPVRCMAPEGNLPESMWGSTSVLTMGVNWAVNNGADIISMSLGIPAGLGAPAGLQDAIINAYNQGVAIFAASGNSGNNEMNFPAAWDGEVFAVGSFSQARNRADFSTWGWYMDALAGGGHLVGSNLSTAEWIWGCYVASVCDQNTGGPAAGSHGYAAAMGTSMACPQAAGIAGLVLSAAPNLVPRSLYNVLRQTSYDVEAPGWDEESGWGILQARNALNLITDPIPLQVTMTPQGSTVIPPGGGNLTFQVQLRNNGTVPYIVDFWTEMVLPSGAPYGPLVTRPAVTVNPGQVITRTMVQSVPGSSPAGNYTMKAIAGFMEGVVKAQGQFNFSKSGVDAGGPVSDWSCSGWDDPVPAASATPAYIPQTATLLLNHPNPFNPETAIGYQLPTPGHVSLRVYDTAGREVATLVNGWREAGRQEVTFDGSGLPSGMYFARLSLGDFTQTQKLVLLK
ncbi:MAG: T9SS C-terminal target domain-containing protein [Candidatus Zixiibacteriota bacterium]|nr:MAG: T9SS C-terminal target domain-containing protein [candidate division Zixibacteria bacterium]